MSEAICTHVFHGYRQNPLVFNLLYPRENGTTIVGKLVTCRAQVPEVVPADDEQVINMAREIWRYLARHPNAADSLEGIQRWWLIGQRDAEATTKVERALELLIAEGLVVKRKLPDGKAIYSGRKEESEQDH